MPQKTLLLKTKFFLPQPTSDFVERKSLVAKFENLKAIPVMLVSASTGYGKSTLIANYFSKLNDNYTWLSLSEKENVFQHFIRYFITAIQSKIKHFGEIVLDLLQAPEPPSADEIAELLVNDMAEFKGLFFFALDDYHLIRNNDIHQFISILFEFPQPYFRLIIITRRDPELPLPEWISKNKLTEIRSSDLKFNKDEIAEFYNKAISYNPNDSILAKLEEVTDGWVSGLRMLTLSTTNEEELQQHFLDYKYKDSRVIYMLVDGILKHQPEQTKDKLLRLSLLKEFNVELFSELCLNEDEKDNNEVLFNEFTAAITKSNMFIIALDDRHKWFRFHHLFIDQLYAVLKSEYDNKSIAELRIKAADWYRINNLPHDAIEFYLKANQVSLALKVFTEYRLQLISANRFDNLETIFNLFPQKLIEQNGILRITRGWLLLQQGNIPQMAICIEPLEQELIQEGHTDKLLNLLLGEVHAMKAFDRYLSNVDIQACLEHSKKAIQLLKDQNPYALGIAWVYYGVSLQHLGNPTKAKKELYHELEITSNVILKGQILIILAFLDWFDVNLTAMQQTANHLLQLGNTSGIKYFIASGNIMLGLSFYYQNKEKKALGYLERAHELRHYALQHMSFPAAMALANIYAQSGKMVESNSIIQTYEKTAIEQSGKLFIKMTKSTASEMAWKYKNELSGLKWATQNDYKDFLPMANLYSPELVQARILARDNDPASLKLSQDIINNTIPFFKDRNDNNILFRSYVIQALLHYKTGDTDKAFETLQRSIKLSGISRNFRPYVELGEGMKNLLIAYKETTKDITFIDEIIKSFPSNGAIIEKNILSEREKELLILSEKLTNKEVGNKLFIAEKTVKSHITNINRKLKVSSKLEAIARAKELSLI